MMVVEETGRTLDEAITAGLGKLGIVREHVVVETLAAGTRGLFGFGGQEARVRLVVTPRGERLIRARRTVEEILAAMRVEGLVRVEERPAGLHMEISGKDGGLLIGKHGGTLEAFQFLVGRILSRWEGEPARVEIDVEGYQKRRRERLEQMALRLAKQVKATGQAVVLEAMVPGDRRIIHVALQGDDQVRTESVGAGPTRRLMILPVPSRPST